MPRFAPSVVEGLGFTRPVGGKTPTLPQPRNPCPAQEGKDGIRILGLVEEPHTRRFATLQP